MTKRISRSVIADLNPCSDRFSNYTDNYNDFEGTYNQFLDLDLITTRDKIWVLARVLPEDIVGEMACRFALSTLHIFENKYPNDDRPRRAIEASRDYRKGKITKAELLECRYAAYDAAYDAAAAYAAYAADAAAAYAADAAAAYAAAAYAAAAYAADAARKKEENFQIEIIRELLKERGLDE